MGFTVPVMFGSGNQLILTVIIHPLGCVEHILRDQFHGRRELAGQDCVLFVESADLRGERVDDVVRVGWNLLSQNVSFLMRNPHNPIGLQGLKKLGNTGQSAAVIVSMRVTVFNLAKDNVADRLVFTSVIATCLPDWSNVASTPRW